MNHDFYSYCFNLIIFLFYYDFVHYIFAKNVDDLREEVQEYETHLKSLYEMEVFHGDETIHAMIKHTTHVLEKIKDFEYFYSLLSVEEEIEEEEEEIEQDPGQKAL